MVRTTPLLSVLLLLSALSVPSPASACDNSVEEERARRASFARANINNADAYIGVLLEAEESLRNGELEQSIHYLEMLQIRPEVATQVALSRSKRVAALISVRTKGEWPRFAPTLPNDETQRRAVLAQAVSALRARAAEDPRDATRQSELGEALATIWKYRSEARKLLEELARDDLLTNAYAYAALANLRRSAGDAKGATVAMEVCRKLDKNVCAPHLKPGA